MVPEYQIFLKEEQTGKWFKFSDFEFAVKNMKWTSEHRWTWGKEVGR